MATGDNSNYSYDSSSDQRSDEPLSDELSVPTETHSLASKSSSPTVPSQLKPNHEFPERIGRYILRSQLGSGGFAEVYLAHDEQLGRNVALKMARLDKHRTPAEIELFIQEARTSAKLQHPGIVSLYDVGSYQGRPYMVLEYIRGRSLAQLLNEEPIQINKAVKLMIQIADALSHAHDRGFVHRDIKPQNIMLDVDDEPHIGDFGLAVKLWEIDDDMALAGTTQYMAPEQIRGESHRIDLRTDIWSLGVIFYRMLTGKMPFTGSTRHDIFEAILYRQPVLLTELNAQTPAELERICMRCLSRQMSDRYPRAAELADDLREWFELTTGGSSRGLSDSNRRRTLAFVPRPDAPLIPRGLRSFEREDGDFFLRLLPGPRDRDGLPATIRFWKGRIENRDSEQTFGVGVLYGPSGCGKSSLVKAGLLPHLHKDVAFVHLEASPERMAERLLKAVSKISRGPLHAKSIDEAFRLLRSSDELRGGRKLLVVIDQFEQWLGTWSGAAEDPLVSALRQCDGGNVQAILMVRDDFWLPLSRMMKSLEIAIVDGVNGMLVDSFDQEHARRVMRELGQAYNRLPVGSPLNVEQENFIDQSIQGLTENNRLYPVRLAVFVEMIKDKPWVPETLKAMGGTKGVGVAFLETTVGSQAISSRRMHSAATRRILTALLPSAGDINDRVLSRGQLLEASQYGERQHEFDTVMRILDVELRLITPTQTSEQALVNESSKSESSHSDSHSQFHTDGGYKLTHDFLVPSIREWLQRQNYASRKGRVLLLLQEQAQIWNSRPHPRFLPTFVEWLSIHLQTSRQEWNEPQRLMMQAATRRIYARSLKTLGVACILLLLGYSLYYPTMEYQSRSEAFTQVSHLKQVDLADLPEALKRLEPYRHWADTYLDKDFKDADLSPPKKLRVALARLSADDKAASWIAEHLITDAIDPRDWPTILGLLQSRQDLCKPAWESLAQRSTPVNKFRALVALWSFNQNRVFWEMHGREIVETLLQQPTSDVPYWLNLLKPASTGLRQTVLALWPEIGELATAKVACMALISIDPGSSDDLPRLLEDASEVGYRAIVDTLKENSESSRALLRSHWTSLDKSNASDLHLANVILALWECGDDSELRTAAKHTLDDSLRSQVIQNLSQKLTPLGGIHALAMNASFDDPCLDVALTALANHPQSTTYTASKEELRRRLRTLYEQCPTSETHSLAGLLLRRQGVSWGELDEFISPRNAPEEQKKWYLSPSGLTLAIIDSPAQEPQAQPSAAYSFAVSVTEVPLGVYHRFDPKYLLEDAQPSTNDRTPVSGLLLIQAAAFCNWLSQLEHIEPEQWCFPPVEQMTVANCAQYPDAQQRQGYRIMSAAEWDLAVGAGTITKRFYGDNDDFLPFYAWSRVLSGRLLHNVGQLLPNPHGLFDVYGNAREICLADPNEQPTSTSKFDLRGGASLAADQMLTTAARLPFDHRSRDPYVGLRVVRTISKN